MQVIFRYTQTRSEFNKTRKQAVIAYFQHHWSVFQQLVDTFGTNE